MWTFLPKIVIETVSIESAFIFEIFGAVFFGLVLLGFMRLDFHIIGTSCAVLAGLFSYVGVYYYFKAAKLNPVGLIASVTSLFPAVTVVLSMLFLGEKASVKRLAGVTLAIVAVYLMNLPKTDNSNIGTGAESAD
jgi:transporter family protein